jgi:hypothetical protein
VRHFSDIALRLAGSSVRAVVLGPYTIPPDQKKHREFADQLRGRMIEALATMRGASTETSPLATRPQPAL